MSKAKRVVIIGWDCAPPQFVLGPWLEEMPNLKALVAEGAAGELESTNPPITVPAWTCMMTSLNPGQLGFFGFRNRRIGEYGGKWIANAAAGTCSATRANGCAPSTCRRPTRSRP